MRYLDRRCADHNYGRQARGEGFSWIVFRSPIIDEEDDQPPLISSAAFQRRNLIFILIVVVFIFSRNGFFLNDINMITVYASTIKLQDNNNEKRIHIS